MNKNLSILKAKTYKVKIGHVGQKPYFMAYKHYLPSRTTGEAVIVFIVGGGHLMKVWEKTPNGRKGWAPLFAERGREVIIVEWACNSPKIYQCSNRELCALTQKENMGLIKKVIEKEAPLGQKVVFLGWSMGGPQAFKLACDILPKRTVAILGYAATGPLNFFKSSAKNIQKSTDLTKPLFISQDWIKKIAPLTFSRRLVPAYRKNYLAPLSPTMAAIQNKKLIVTKYWPILTIKEPHNLPPVLLINGSLDFGHRPKKEKLLVNWLKKFQQDITIKYVKNFNHLGMLNAHNKNIAKLYLDWLIQRNL